MRHLSPHYFFNNTTPIFAPKNVFMKKHGFIFLAVLLLPALLYAQISDPGCDVLDPLCPIDGGLSLLIAAGIGIGAKKAYDSKKKGEVAEVVE